MESLNIHKQESVNEKLIDEMVELDKKCFPGGLFIQKEDLTPMLENPDLVLDVVRGSDDKLIGYAYGMPLRDVFEELKEADVDLQDEEGVLYLYSTATDPENRSLEMFFRLIKGFEDKVRQKGYKKIQRHSRVTEGYSAILQKRYDYKYIRTMENWMHSGEKFDFLEKEIDD